MVFRSRVNDIQNVVKLSSICSSRIFPSSPKETPYILKLWWLTPIIPATWEAEIEWIEVQGRLGQKHKTLSEK
jgi:hypothetical protein